MRLGVFWGGAVATGLCCVSNWDLTIVSYGLHHIYLNNLPGGIPFPCFQKIPTQIPHLNFFLAPRSQPLCESSPPPYKSSPPLCESSPPPLWVFPIHLCNFLYNFHLFSVNSFKIHSLQHIYTATTGQNSYGLQGLH